MDLTDKKELPAQFVFEDRLFVFGHDNIAVYVCANLVAMRFHALANYTLCILLEA